MAVNDLGEDIKELSITIVKAPETEYAVTVRDDGHGTGSADPASATAGIGDHPDRYAKRGLPF